MTREEKINAVIAISSTLPITTDDDDPNPRQLYLYKEWKYVESYDPVDSINISGDLLIIYNWRYYYEHLLEEFDEILVKKYISDAEYRDEFQNYSTR